ncbi:THxN family PEP-CTERM protein [Photobacterium sp. WH77]|uniref:THxN family PEP-CTERM protein n=1 Tax=unclassified Photobacterium TaxID=2628852 RepID=UPI001EDBABEA|nr:MULTISPECIES: THxN family PEP-CTERM protein [unclassified Photobacterium]MCG2838479.1 THxN family PEP-CTERM protein [Photobacterium sp. WH77]MCG2846149.1 THxN family PEP-CTERM protein [Photobacterium sp. WH80]
MKPVTKITMFSLAMLASAHVNAALVTVEFGAFTGSWVNAVADTGSGQPMTIGNATDNPMLRWGLPSPSSGPQSGYDFASAASFDTTFDTDTGTSDDFQLGTFTHLNNVILSSGASLQSVDLQLSTTVSIDGGTPVDVQFVFNFTHNETSNSADPCANGEANGVGVNVNGCADIITVSTSQFTDVTTINGIQYTVNIQGFLVNGLFADRFETVEQSTNQAFIQANISALTEVPVPEPASVAILGTVLAGIAMIRRRKRQNQRQNLSS